MRAFRRTMMVYGANMARAGLGFIVTLLVARLLGPEQFGIYSLFIVVMVVAHNLLGEGLDPAVVRCFARYADRQPERARQVLQASLALRVGLALPIVGAGWMAAPWFAEAILGNHTLALPLRMGLLCGLTASLCTFTLAGLQARERFVAYAALTPLVNTLRVVAAPLLLVLGLFTLPWLMGLHVALFLVGAVAGMWLLRDTFAHFRVEAELAHELLHFSKWTALASLSFLLLATLSVPALNALGTAHDAGLYAAGASLLMVVDQITVAILTVRAPAVSRLEDRTAFLAYVRKALPTALYLALPLCLLTLAARPLMLLVYGAEYEGSAAVLQVLIAGFLATLIAHPLSLVFYAMNRPDRYAVTAVAAFLAWAAAAWILIPTNGALGAAMAVCIARVLQAALIGALLWHGLRESPAPAKVQG